MNNVTTTGDPVKRARELIAATTQGPLDLIRYEHGGGRLYKETSGGRALVADFYDQGNRELYAQARDLITALADECERRREDPLESALKELREMFPSGPSEIQIRTDNVYTIWFWPSKQACIRLYRTSQTLSEAMAQVRGYWKEQTK